MDEWIKKCDNTHNEILCSSNKGQNHAICINMDGVRGYMLKEFIQKEKDRCKMTFLIHGTYRYTAW